MFKLGLELTQMNRNDILYVSIITGRLCGDPASSSCRRSILVTMNALHLLFTMLSVSHGKLGEHAPYRLGLTPSVTDSDQLRLPRIR